MAIFMPCGHNIMVNWLTYHGRSAYRRIRTLRSFRRPRHCSTAEEADGATLTGESEIRARWAGYVEELHRVDRPPTECAFPGDIDAVRDAELHVSCASTHHRGN